jgi:hypothetical protein
MHVSLSIAGGEGYIRLIGGDKKKKMKNAKGKDVLVKSIVGEVVLTAVFLIFLVGSASAGCVGVDTGTDYGCGDTVTESCTFNKNLSCPSGRFALIVGADNITIDGNSYTLDGVSSDACDAGGIQRSGIYNKAHDDVVIKDLEVKNFCNGIYFKYDSEEGDRVEGVTIDNCDIHHNGGDTGGDNSVHGIKAIGVFGSMIKNCKIHHNTGKGDSCEGGGNGIFLKGISGYGAWDNLITHNEIYDNTKGGFFTKMMCTDTEVSYNKLWGNGQGGVILRCMKSETHDIHHNNASYNYGSGIFIGGPNNTVRYNIASYNKNGSEYSGIGIGPGSGSPGKYGMGICMGRSDGSFHNEVLSNEVCGNEGVDIEVCPACEGNTGDDNTCDTTFSYDDEGTTGCTCSCGPTPTPIFDTDSGTYPSIFGTHNGTITPNKAIPVHRLYTYPCSGTGGHTEYVMIYNESGTIAEAYWNGYIGDYHNMTFNTTFTLFAGCTYNYTIRTGSYPQIVHAREYKAEGGNIPCTVFIDANGKKYDDWIPAIRLWRE